MSRIISLKAFYSAMGVLVWIGYIGLAAIVLVVFVDVCGRYLLNKPLTGAYELVELSMTLFGGFAILYTTVKREHVGVDFLVVRFPRRTRTALQRIGSLVGLGAWAVLTYWAYLRAMELFRSPYGEITSSLHIPIAPFMLILAVATFLGCLALLIQFFHPFVSEETQEKRKKGPDEY